MHAVSAPSTFDRLVATHRDEVLRLCRAVVREEHLSLDAAQETFVRLWRRNTSGRAPDDARAWLRRVAVSTALDLARQRRANARLGAPGDLDELEHVAARSSEPIEALESGELEHRLRAALATLPEGQRTIFLLRHEAGLSLSDVAATLELAPTTVKTQFARAVLKLQAQLSRHRNEDRS